MNTLMQQAIQFANDHESTWDRSVKGNFGVHLNDPPPWNKLLGPIHDRGPVSGVVAGLEAAEEGTLGMRDNKYEIGHFRAGNRMGAARRGAAVASRHHGPRRRFPICRNGIQKAAGTAVPPWVQSRVPLPAAPAQLSGRCLPRRRLPFFSFFSLWGAWSGPPCLI